MVRAEATKVLEIFEQGNVVASEFYLDHGQCNFILLVQYEDGIFVCEAYVSDSGAWGKPGRVKCVKQILQAVTESPIE